jgi:hypothetical protein
MKRAENAPLRFARRLLAGLMAFCCCLAVTFTLHAAEEDFPADAEFNILSPDGSRVIGHTHYSAKPDGPSMELIYGESHYLTGEYDIEHNKVEKRGSGELPVLADYEHAFFNADGSLVRMIRANFRTGEALCATYDKDDTREYRTTLNFPPDTYAGAALVIPLQHQLNESSKGPIELHDFTCIPEPKILKVQAYPAKFEPWLNYRGNMLQVDIKPDFGWLNLMIAPFVPKIHAWFDPSGAWDFIGGEFTRYYKGPQIILARVPLVTGMAPDAAPPEMRSARQAVESAPAAQVSASPLTSSADGH